VLYLRSDAAMAFEACKLVALKEQRGDEVRADKLLFCNGLLCISRVFDYSLC